MPPSNPCSVPRYERTTLYTPHKLTDLQADILILLGAPHTLEHVLKSLQALHQRPHLYRDIWQEIVILRKHGLIKIYPPQIVYVVPRNNVFERPQFKQTHRRPVA